MEKAELHFNLASDNFKLKLLEFEQSIKSYKENKLLDKLKVDTELLKDAFARWAQAELKYLSTMDSRNQDIFYFTKPFEFEDTFLNLLNKANKLILEAESKTVLNIENLPWSSNSCLYLPRFILTQFSGRKEHWLVFANLFKFTIHDNSSLNDEMRFWYLRALLDSKTASIIEQYTNYTDAWQYLEQHFTDPLM